VSCDCSIIIMLKDLSDDPWFCSICRSAYSPQCLVCVWIELVTSKGKDFVTFYHPPSSSVNDLQQLMSSIFIVNSQSPLIMCGDFNVPEISWHLTVPLISTPPM